MLLYMGDIPRRPFQYICYSSTKKQDNKGKYAARKHLSVKASKQIPSRITNHKYISTFFNFT